MALMESKVRKTGLKCYVRGHLSLTARERPRASRGIIERAEGPTSLSRGGSPCRAALAALTLLMRQQRGGSRQRRGSPSQKFGLSALVNFLISMPAYIKGIRHTEIRDRGVIFVPIRREREAKNKLL